METRAKLAIFDLDGTLFDTKNVNYKAYSDAIEACGFDISIDYEYYRDFCNGSNFKVFLPKLIPLITEDEMQRVHDKKKELYSSCMKDAKMNKHLFSMIELMRKDYKIAIVTTASRQNVEDILGAFQVKDVFDLIFTQEDVKMCKPDPEGFLLAMKKAGCSEENTIIFEDSDIGIEAAARSGAKYLRVYGYN